MDSRQLGRGRLHSSPQQPLMQQQAMMPLQPSTTQHHQQQQQLVLSNESFMRQLEDSSRLSTQVSTKPLVPRLKGENSTVIKITADKLSTELSRMKQWKKTKEQEVFQLQKLLEDAKKKTEGQRTLIANYQVKMDSLEGDYRMSSEKFAQISTHIESTRNICIDAKATHGKLEDVFARAERMGKEIITSNAAREVELSKIQVMLDSHSSSMIASKEENDNLFKELTERYEHDLGALRAEKANLQLKIDHLHENVLSVSGLLKEAEAGRDFATAAVSRLEHSMNELREQLDSTNVQFVTFRETSSASLQDLRLQLENKEILLGVEKSEKSVLQESMRNKEESLESAKSELARAARECATLTEKLSPFDSTRLELQETKEKLERKEKAFMELTAKFNDEISHVKLAEAEVLHYKESCHRLTESLATANTEKVQLMSSLHTMTADLESSKKELANTIEFVAQQEAKFLVVQNALENEKNIALLEAGKVATELESKLHAVQLSLDHANLTISKVEQVSESLRQELALEKKVHHEEIASSKASFEQQIGELTAKDAILKETHHITLAALENECVNLREQVSALQNEVTALERNDSKKSDSLDSVEAKLLAKSKEIKDVERELKESEKRAKDLDKKLNAKTAEVDKLLAEAEAFRQKHRDEYEAQDARLSRLNAETDARLKGLEEEKIDFLAKISDLEQRVLEADKSTARKVSEALEKFNTDSNRTKEKDARDREKALKEKDSLIFEQQAKLADLQSQILRLETEAQQRTPRRSALKGSPPKVPSTPRSSRKATHTKEKTVLAEKNDMYQVAECEDPFDNLAELDNDTALVEAPTKKRDSEVSHHKQQQKSVTSANSATKVPLMPRTSHSSNSTTTAATWAEKAQPHPETQVPLHPSRRPLGTSLTLEQSTKTPSVSTPRSFTSLAGPLPATPGPRNRQPLPGQSSLSTFSMTNAPTTSSNTKNPVPRKPNPIALLSKAKLPLSILGSKEKKRRLGGTGAGGDDDDEPATGGGGGNNKLNKAGWNEMFGFESDA